MDNILEPTFRTILAPGFATLTIRCDDTEAYAHYCQDLKARRGKRESRQQAIEKVLGALKDGPVPTEGLLTQLNFSYRKLIRLAGATEIRSGIVWRGGKKVLVFWLTTAPPLLSELSIRARLVHFLGTNPWTRLVDVPKEICSYKAGGRALSELVKNETLLCRLGHSNKPNRPAREYAVNPDKNLT